MSFDIQLLGTILLGLMALAALAVAWGVPFRREPEPPAVWISPDELARECEARAAWVNPHARPQLSGAPDALRSRSRDLHLGAAALAHEDDRRDERDHGHDGADQERAGEPVGERNVGRRPARPELGRPAGEHGG